MSPERFNAYLDAFNRPDFEQLETFFAPDLVFEHLPPLPRLEGRAQLIDFYRNFKTRVAETIEPVEIIFGTDRIAAEVRGSFTALEDMPDFAATPMLCGETFTLTGIVFYTARNGRFTHIRNVARTAATHRNRTGLIRNLLLSGYARN
jgi:hypothetical protein